MSLKTFHIVFIVISTILTAGFAVWCFAEYRRGDAMVYAALGSAMVLAAVALAIYGLRFLRKSRDVGYL